MTRTGAIDPNARGPAAVMFTSGELAARLQAELRGPSTIRIRGLESLDAAGPEQLSFVRDPKFWTMWSASRCGAALVSRRAAESAPPPGDRAQLIVPDADSALIQILSMMSPPPTFEPGIHESAVIDSTATVSKSAHIGPGVVIGPRSFVGERAAVLANSVLGADVSIGRHSVIYPNVVIQDRCILGEHVTLHPGVVVGADGFGYYPDPRTRMPMKIPHIGSVVIEDHVEIGSNSTIDRGKFGATRIGAGTKIDNLVQIAHNCVIGKCCIICGMSGLSGSVTLGDGVTLAGRVGIADNHVIGAGATVGAGSGVMDDIPPGETWLGHPARPGRTALRIIASIQQLPDLAAEVRKLVRSQAGSSQNPIKPPAA
ncbi:MAG: UDP-3-O-(3-hydroxymyristoyl)glucosamine N-acyltransferase [Phycisphaerae bacterium]|nr:UDP-3-O-(3-hydroxymyristoyl)glucosamine N-acyltransferase [Phycisphaerae bacterium]